MLAQNQTVLHNLSASIVLATVLFCSTKLADDNPNIISHRQHINTILQTLTQHCCKNPNPVYRKVAEHAYNIISALMRVEADRRSSRSPIDQASNSLADVFKQVASAVSRDELASSTGGNTTESPVILTDFSNGFTPPEDETAKMFADMDVFVSSCTGLIYNV